MVNMMLAPVHKIGEPCSLVEEIKPASIACLKGKYADNQADKGTPAAFAKQDKKLAMKVEKEMAERRRSLLT